MTASDDYEKRVLAVVEAIPPGQVMAYGDIAEYVGEGGPRQVGRVMLLSGGSVLWWRVLHADGSPPAGYELGRIATAPITTRELESAVNYLTGLLSLQTATQAGLAGVLETLLADGLDVSWLREHPAALARATVDDVLEQARRFLAPAGLATIVVGDASRVGESVAALSPVVIRDVE